jgi:CheY-like chemotaxis protein
VKLFLAEDNDADLMLLRFALAESGRTWTLQRAKSTCEAISAIRQNGFSPDLILLDLHVPGPPVAEVLNAIRAQKILDQIPVAIWSGLFSPMEKEALLKRGPYPLFEKPADLNSWRDLVCDLEKLVDTSAQSEFDGESRLKNLAATCCAA